MRLLRRKEDEFVFQLGKREKIALCHLLSRYPMVPQDYNTLSRSGDLEEMRVDAELLEEALASTRAESKRAVEALIRDEKHLKANSRGWRLTLGKGEMDWMLQILGDIRVGCWLQLDCPEQNEERLEDMSPEKLDSYVAMEMSGSLQMFLLHALHAGDAPETPEETDGTEEA